MRDESDSGQVETAAARRRWIVGAAAATVVAVVFAVWGDGVPPVATGRWGSLVDASHAVAWVLLALATWTAAVARRWTSLSTAFSATALALYLAFLVALFT